MTDIYRGGIGPGDLVAVIAPSGPVDPDGLAAGTALLESWGLRVRVLGHALDRTGYLAGADADRAADFVAAWADPQVAAVLCARGGYGAQRMVDLVDWAALRRAAGPAQESKPFVGSSDVTALHEAIAHHLGAATFYGPMVASPTFRDDPASADCLRRTLWSGPQELVAPDGVPLVGGTATGVLVGGTLTLITSGLATPTCRFPDRAIAFLEDVDEEPYRLDRCLTQLLRAGWFTGVRGIVLGSFLRCGAPDAVQSLMRDRLGDLGVPILWGFPAGHGRPQLTLPLGIRVRLDAGAGTLSPVQVAGPAAAAPTERAIP